MTYRMKCISLVLLGVIIAGIGVLILGLILWNRASYTSTSRDQRYWNRRYLGLGDANLQAQIQCNITS